MVIPLSELEINYKIGIDSMRKEIALYRRIQQFLNLLHITEDFDLAAINKNSNWNELMLFVSGIVDKKPISFKLDKKESFRLNWQNIGNLCILFSMTKPKIPNRLF